MSRSLFREIDPGETPGSFAVGTETLEHIGDNVHAATQHVAAAVKSRLARFLVYIGEEKSRPSPLLPLQDETPVAEVPEKETAPVVEVLEKEKVPEKPPVAEAPGEQKPVAVTTGKK